MKRCALILVLLAMAAPALAVWPPAQRITTGPADNLYPSVSYYEGTYRDTVCLVWQRSRTSGWDIYYSTNPMGTAWTSPQLLTNQADSNLTPAIGGFHSRWVCAWVNVHGGIQDISFSRWQSGAWTAPIAISMDGFDDADPAAWIAEFRDSIWVAWASYRSGRWSIISRVYNGSSWSPEIPVVTSAGNNRAPRFFQYAQPFRTLGLVWQGNANGNWDIYLSKFQGGIWTPPVAVTLGPQTDIAPAPAQPYRITPTMQLVDLVWASDSLGNFEILGTMVDSPAVRERITSNDSSDIEPAALNHGLPSVQAEVFHPILTAWTSRRDGNPNIYGQVFGPPDVVDTNRAYDAHPVVTAFIRGFDFHEWVIWESNRDGNWNLFGSYKTHWSGVEEGEENSVGISSLEKTMIPSPFHPPGRLTLYLSGIRALLPLKFYDSQGRLVGTRTAEKKASGQYQLSWDCKDASGSPLPSGLYFLRAEGSPALYRLILLR
jgi:FlgD Ig-like domain